MVLASFPVSTPSYVHTKKRLGVETGNEAGNKCVLVILIHMRKSIQIKLQILLLCFPDGFCTRIRPVNCTFDIFPFIECNPFCIADYVSVC